MSSAIGFILDQSKILSSGNGLIFPKPLSMFLTCISNACSQYVAFERKVVVSTDDEKARKHIDVSLTATITVKMVFTLSLTTN